MQSHDHRESSTVYLGMADSLGADNMQAGSIASAYSGRHFRFITVVTALIVVDMWLWVRLGLNLTSTGLTGELLVAVSAATVSLCAIVALWRNPLGSVSPAMATPALRHAQATHHAGHIIAIHTQDPTRISRARLSDPCTPAPPNVPQTSQTALRTELTIALAGISAEEIFSGESGAHAEADLARATVIGADMVGRLGMTGSLVSLATSRVKSARFVDKVLADARTRKELESLLRDSKRDSVRILLENRHLIIAVRDALMRNDSLKASEIHGIIHAAEERRHSDDEVLVDLRSASDRTRPLVSASEL